MCRMFTRKNKYSLVMALTRKINIFATNSIFFYFRSFATQKFKISKVNAMKIEGIRNLEFVANFQSNNSRKF